MWTSATRSLLGWRRSKEHRAYIDGLGTEFDPDQFLRDNAGYGGMAAGCEYAVLLHRYARLTERAVQLRSRARRPRRLAVAAAFPVRPQVGVVAFLEAFVGVGVLAGHHDDVPVVDHGHVLTVCAAVSTGGGTGRSCSGWRRPGAGCPGRCSAATGGADSR